jgi:hypothetical protein
MCCGFQPGAFAEHFLTFVWLSMAAVHSIVNVLSTQQLR